MLGRPARRPGAAVALAVLLWLVLLPAGQPALAHAALERADPAPGAGVAVSPEAVTLWFSEPIVARYSRVAVLDATGQPVTRDNPALLPGSDATALRQPLRPNLPDGAYVVVWSVYSSIDAHVSTGVYSFTVGAGLPLTPEQETALAAGAFAARGAPAWVDTGARWLNLLGGTLLFGAFACVPLVLVPTAGAPIPARRFRRLAGVGFALLAAGHLASAGVQASDATGDGLTAVAGQPLWTLLTETRFGALWLARAALIATLALPAWVITRGARLLLPRRGRAGALWALMLLGLAGLLLTTSLGSHAAAAERRPRLAILLDWLHLGAAGVWLGGLACLAVIVPPLAARDAAVWRRALSRFGRVAAIAAAVLALTGLVAARRLVGGVDGIVGTRYGLWFSLKLVLAAAALGLAAWRPLLARRRGVRLEQRLSAGEAALGVLVVLAAAAMTAAVPGAIEIGAVQPVYGETTLAGGHSITFRASPGRVGANEFSLVVASADPGFSLPPEHVTLVFEPSGATLDLRAPSLADPWTFRGAGSQIDQPGTWRVIARIAWPDGERQQVAFDLEARRDALYPAGFAPPDTGSRLSLLLGLGWIALAVALAAAGRRLRPHDGRLAWALMSLAMATLLLGAGLTLVGLG